MRFHSSQTSSWAAKTIRKTNQTGRLEVNFGWIWGKFPGKVNPAPLDYDKIKDPSLPSVWLHPSCHLIAFS